MSPSWTSNDGASWSSAVRSEPVDAVSGEAVSVISIPCCSHLRGCSHHAVRWRMVEGSYRRFLLGDRLLLLFAGRLAAGRWRLPVPGPLVAGAPGTGPVAVEPDAVAPGEVSAGLVLDRLTCGPLPFGPDAVSSVTGRDATPGRL